MTKKQLINLLEEYPDDIPITIRTHRAFFDIRQVCAKPKMYPLEAGDLGDLGDYDHTVRNLKAWADRNECPTPVDIVVLSPYSDPFKNSKEKGAH